MTDLTSLIARLEQAESGSREWDAEIAFAIEWLPVGPSKLHQESFVDHMNKHGYWKAWMAHAPWRHEWLIPAFTTSLDEAITLVPDGWLLIALGSSVATGFAPGPSEVTLISMDDEVAARANTHALALASAALKARSRAEG